VATSRRLLEASPPDPTGDSLVDPADP